MRVALRHDPDPNRELAYRLLLTEVPQSTDKNFTGLRVALQLSLPVFIKPAAAATPSLAWHGLWQADGTLSVTASNSGAAHLQISDFSLQFTGNDRDGPRRGHALCAAGQHGKLDTSNRLPAWHTMV